MRHALYFLAALLAGNSPLPAAANSFTIEGRVIYLGASVPGAEVLLQRPGGAVHTVFTDDEGAFQFTVVPGVYSIEAGMVGFFPVTVSQIRVGEASVAGILIYLSPNPLLMPDPGPLVRRPEQVEAPELGVLLQLERALRSDQVVRGTVEIRNLGHEPVLLPVDAHRQQRPTEDGFLLMNLTAGSREYLASSNYWFECFFPVNCRTLDPGQALSIPVEFHVSAHPDTPQVFHSKGRYEFGVVLSLVLPGLPMRRTKAVSAKYLLEIDYP